MTQVQTSISQKKWTDHFNNGVLVLEFMYLVFIVVSVFINMNVWSVFSGGLSLFTTGLVIVFLKKRQERGRILMIFCCLTTLATNILLRFHGILDPIILFWNYIYPVVVVMFYSFNDSIGNWFDGD